ncbi:UVI-1 [Xylariaceae sp. FL0594]|nr:UVI-1 [Xylariaceae sp. FL0594]
MRFTNIFNAGLAMASSAMCALTPQQIADGLGRITDESRALQEPAESITIVNAPLIVIGQGPFPTIISGFAEIVTTANVLIGGLDGTPAIADAADATLVFDAFRTFVGVHQALLNILIGKAGIIEKVPVVGQPVASALRGVEGVVDSIAIFLINNVESRAVDLGAEANSLDTTLDLAISKYEGIAL